MLAAEQLGLSLTAVWSRVCQWCREAGTTARTAPAQIRKEA